MKALAPSMSKSIRFKTKQHISSISQQGSLMLISIILLSILSLTSGEIVTQHEIVRDKKSAEMKLTQFESPIQEVLWCGASSVLSESGEMIDYSKEVKFRKLFLLTEKGQLHVSNDNGSNFDLVNTELLALIPSNKKPSQLVVRDIILSPVNNRKVFLFTETGQGFFTDNCGVSYKPTMHNPQLHTVQPSPINQNMLIGLTPTDCQPSQVECNSTLQNLVFSSDNGINWKEIIPNVELAQWDIKQSPPLNKQNRIIVAHFDIVQSKDDKKSELHHRKVSYTEDFGQSMVLLEKGGVHFYQSNEYMFILKQGKEYGKYSLVVGSSLVDDTTERTALELPVKGIKDESFTVLDISEGAILISINHEGDSKGYTNFYVSNSSGKKFTLSLSHIVSDSDMNVDFEPILSNEGTYISNSYPSNMIKKNKIIEAKKTDQRAGGQQNSQTSAMKVDTNFDLKSYRKTKISFNRGGKWHPLKAPDVNVNNNPYKCSGECSLHLKGRTDLHGTRVYSSSNAPGIILGTGNVGEFLTQDINELRTYLSRDGGHTWQEIMKGSHEYEIADQGGIIAMARDDVESNEVVYSLDEGDSWQSIQFPNDVKFRVDSFLTEQNNEERTFLFFGKRAGKKNREEIGVVGSLNFSKVNRRVCAGFETPGEDESDYERWSPLNYSGKKCLFGAKVSYTRKRRDAECYNDNKIGDLRKVFGACECTQEDFECDFGYVVDEKRSQKCVPINQKIEQELEEKAKIIPTKCINFYYISQGYRKLPNNRCEGGVEEIYGPKQIRCPEQEIQQPKDTFDKRRQPTQFTGSTRVNNGNEEPTGYSQSRAKSGIINQNEDSSESSSWLSLFVWLGVLAGGFYALITYRREALYYVKTFIMKVRGRTGKDHEDFYGGKRSNNDAEQFSLFHNDNEQEYEPEQL